jgi:hypothetical protein
MVHVFALSHWTYDTKWKFKNIRIKKHILGMVVFFNYFREGVRQANLDWIYAPIYGTFWKEMQKNTYMIWSHYKEWADTFTIGKDVATNYYRKFFIFSFYIHKYSKIYIYLKNKYFFFNDFISASSMPMYNFQLRENSVENRGLDRLNLYFYYSFRFLKILFIWIYKFWNNLNYFIIYYFFYFYFYTAYFIFSLYNLISILFLFFIFNFNIVVFRHYFFIFCSLVYSHLLTYKIVLFFIKIINYIILIIHFIKNIIVKILNIIIFIFNLIFKIIIIIFNKLSSFHLPLNVKICLMYLQFIFIRYNILWKIFCLIFHRFIYLLILFMIAFAFFDIEMTNGKIDFYSNIMFVVGRDFLSIGLFNFFNLDYSIFFDIKAFIYFKADEYFFYDFKEWEYYFYDQSWLHARFYHMVRRFYKFSKNNPWVWSLFAGKGGDQFAAFLNKIGFDYNFYLCQIYFRYKKWIYFMYYNNALYIKRQPIWYLLLLLKKKFIFFPIYFFFEWFYNYFFLLIFYYINTYIFGSFILRFFLDCAFFLFNLLRYIFVYFMVKIDLLALYTDIYNYLHLYIIEHYTLYYKLIIKYKIAKYCLVDDILKLIGYFGFKFYYFFVYHFFFFSKYILNFVYLLANFCFGGFKTLNFNWQLTDFSLFISKILSFFLLPLDTISIIFAGKTLDKTQGYFEHYKPVYVMLGTEFSSRSIKCLLGSQSLEKSVFQLLLLKVKSLDKVFFDIDIIYYKDLFLYFAFYKYLIFVSFMIIFTLTFKSYKTSFKQKDYLTLSAINSWHRINKDFIRTKLTLKELKWLQSLEWVKQFNKYNDDIFFYDWFWKHSPGKLHYFLYNWFFHYYYSEEKSKTKFIKRTKGYILYKSLDEYVQKRYFFMANIADDLFKLGIKEWKKGRDILRDHKFFMPKYEINNELNKKELKFNAYVPYADEGVWSLMFVVPFMYTFCDDPRFIRHITSHEKYKTYFKYLLKAQTLLQEKNWQVDFFEFIFFEIEFTDSLTSNFLDPRKQDESETFYQLSMSRAWNTVIFKPFNYPIRGNEDFEKFLEKCLKVEDYFFSLSRWDKKYFDSFFNFNWHAAMEWGKIQRTKVRFEDIAKTFNVWDPNQAVEEIRYIPAKYASGGDNPNLKVLEIFIHNYFKSTLKRVYDVKNPQVFYNDIGLYISTDKILPYFGYVWVYPTLIFSFMFEDIFFSYGQPVEIYSILFGYVFDIIKDMNGFLYENYLFFISSKPWTTDPEGSLTVTENPILLGFYFKGMPKQHWSHLKAIGDTDIKIIMASSLVASQDGFFMNFFLVSNDNDALEYMNQNIVLSSDDRSRTFYYGDDTINFKVAKKHFFEYVILYSLLVYSYCFWWIIPVMYIFIFIIFLYIVVYYLVFNFYFYNLEFWNNKKNLIRRNKLYDLFSKK